MRVLTFLHSFEPGGVERVALRLVSEWQNAGEDAPMLMGRKDGAMRAMFENDVDYTVLSPLPISTAYFETLWMIVRLPAHILTLRPDILFCAGNSYSVVAVAMKLLLGRRCPPVVAKISNDLARHDMPAIARPFYRLWLRIQGAVIDQFVGMEQPMAQEIAGAMGIDRQRVSIIRDPALSHSQVEQLARLSANTNKNGQGRRFVAIGRLVRQKNFTLMLRAFAQVADENDSLVIFGEGPERSKLESLIAALGLKGRARLAGHVDDPAARLHQFDIFLLSSDYEGVPAVILEALAAGLPIIATDCCVSMAALLGDGQMGRLIPPHDEQEFALAIADAAPGTQNRTASLAQARRFTVENAAHAYMRCFNATHGAAGRTKKIPSFN